ncbi:MAG: hypothetical protein E6Q97_15755 [Desulfurellales bacterium]|nr:MAG: hypothetical protein E6Q97_15755 [Desulfurellales bacterium]
MKPINVEKRHRSLMRKWRRTYDERAKAMREAAPDVCVWHARGILHGAQIYAASCDGRARATYGMSLCPHCDRKISIKSEAER